MSLRASSRGIAGPRPDKPLRRLNAGDGPELDSLLEFAENLFCWSSIRLMQS